MSEVTMSTVLMPLVRIWNIRRQRDVKWNDLRTKFNG